MTIIIFMVVWVMRKIVADRVKLTEHHPGMIKGLGVLHIIHHIITPFMVVFIIEFGSNPTPEKLRVVPLMASVIVVALLELFFVMIAPFQSFGLGFIYVMAVTFAVSNDYLIRLRAIPLMAVDIMDIGTMGGVAGGYDLTPSVNAYAAFCIGLINMMVAFTMGAAFRKFIKGFYSYKKNLIVGAASLLTLIIFINNVGFSYTFGIVMSLWKPGGTYAENSAIASFVSYAQFSAIGKPEGYSKDDVKRILSDAEEAYDKKYGDNDTGKRPNVISIMNESFTDYTVFGLNSPNEHLQFYKSLEDDPGTIWQGYTYVSTYGGGTARSEFEFLTGYTMAMFANAQPYSQFNFSNIYTEVKNMKEQGYATLAMHPEDATNYRRHTVYPQMGFDNFLSFPDFDGYDILEFADTGNFVNPRVSDSGDYKRMIDADEEIDDPLFVHNVTMQNHGGYDYDVPSRYRADVDPGFEISRPLVTFESLLMQSDKAIKELIEYYRNSDTPTIICLYGDHHPNMSDGFVSERIATNYESDLGVVGNEEKRYKVPFIIWANFDPTEACDEFNFRGETLASQNYLGVATRALAGTKLSAFDKYLLMLREEIPVINESGYIAGGKWHSQDEENEYTDLIREYECVQYAGMFDGKGLESWFSVEGK